jgi:hypothetical protein
MAEDDWIKNHKEYFYHISRNAELVVLKDRDVVAFIPDSINMAGTQGMTVFQDGAQSRLQYESPMIGVQASERLLLWTRISGTSQVTGFRWVPYITSSDPDFKDILPLREVYAPRVVYDRTSNMLHLWFWTNVKWDYDGTEYDETQIVPAGYRSYESFMDLANNKMTLKRVLCYAVGQFDHLFVKGGLIGLQGPQESSGIIGVQGEDAQYDLYPVFTKPVIINNYSVDGLQNAPGMVTDGWTDFTGIQEGPSGPQGANTDPQTPPEGEEEIASGTIPMYPIMVFINQKPYVTEDYPVAIRPPGAGVIANWPTSITVVETANTAAWIMVTLSAAGDYNHVVEFQSGPQFPPWSQPIDPTDRTIWRPVLSWFNDSKVVRHYSAGEISFYVP